MPVFSDIIKMQLNSAVKYVGVEIRNIRWLVCRRFGKFESQLGNLVIACIFASERIRLYTAIKLFECTLK